MPNRCGGGNSDLHAGVLRDLANTSRDSMIKQPTGQHLKLLIKSFYVIAIRFCRLQILEYFSRLHSSFKLPMTTILVL